MGNRWESDQEGSARAFNIGWNFIQVKPCRWRSPPPIRITTELKTLVPQVDVTASTGHAVPGLRNAFDMGKAWARVFIQLRAPAPQADTAAPVRPVEGPPTNRWLSETVQRFATYVGAEAAPRDARALPQISFDRAPAPALVNTVKPLPAVLNRLDTGLQGRPTSLLFWEVASVVRRAGGQLAESLARGRDQAKALLEEVQRTLDATLLPLPAPAAATVRTRGGAVRVKGKAKRVEPRPVSAVVLDGRWEPERTLQLPVRKSLQIDRGQLSMAAAVEDASLAGRVADLVLVAHGMEVALTSTAIERWGEAAIIAFDLDLDSAGIKVAGGTLPLDALRVVIEPGTERTPGMVQEGRQG